MTLKAHNPDYKDAQLDSTSSILKWIDQWYVFIMLRSITCSVTSDHTCSKGWTWSKDWQNWAAQTSRTCVHMFSNVAIGLLVCQTMYLYYKYLSLCKLTFLYSYLQKMIFWANYIYSAMLYLSLVGFQLYKMKFRFAMQRLFAKSALIHKNEIDRKYNWYFLTYSWIYIEDGSCNIKKWTLYWESVH